MNTIPLKSTGQYYAIHLVRGDDILKSIESFIQELQIKDGAIVSGIGTVDQCVLHFVTDASDAGAMKFREWNDVPLEVVGMQGIIADGKPHIHVTVSDDTCSWSGHLEPGCRTLFLCEIVVLVFEGETMVRRPATTDLSDSNHFIMDLVSR